MTTMSTQTSIIILQIENYTNQYCVSSRRDRRKFPRCVKLCDIDFAQTLLPGVSLTSQRQHPATFVLRICDNPADDLLAIIAPVRSASVFPLISSLDTPQFGWKVQ